MAKITVAVKRIEVIGDEVSIILHPLKPKQKNVPWSSNREELDRNNTQFQINSEQQRQDMEEYEKEIHKIHIGRALLIQDEEIGREI